MAARFAPSIVLSLAAALGVVLAALVIGIAMDQRWLGLHLSSTPDNHWFDAGVESVWINGFAPAGPSEFLPPYPLMLTAISDDAGNRVSLVSEDLIEDPSGLASYESLNAFFARQSAIAWIIRENYSVRLEVQTSFGDAEIFEVMAEHQRAVTSLPAAFWVQLGVGLAGFWTGVWVWTMRASTYETRLLAVAGTGLMLAAFPAAIYSTRELAIDGNWFVALHALKQAGLAVFAAGTIGLFMLYPRRVAGPIWTLFPATVLALWQVAGIVHLAPGPLLGAHLPMIAAMATIAVLVALQFGATRADPRARAALKWLGLSVLVGTGAFVATTVGPILFGMTPVIPQGVAFLFFMLIYGGVALGVARYRLFQLEDWAFRTLFYVGGVLLLLVIDAVLVMTIVDERAPAFALSLVILALIYLPLRDTLASRVLRRREPPRDVLFGQVVDVALTPPGRDQNARWEALLRAVFEPLQIAPQAGIGKLELIEDGIAMAVPGFDGLSGYRLGYAHGGRKLFGPRDMGLAGELNAMLTNAIESRRAYEKGVAQERARIARDIHDNIGVQLLGALHSRESERKDVMIRETLTDLRGIINNASRPELCLEDMVADLRSQISEHLDAADIALHWALDGEGDIVISISAAHTLRSMVREAIQNVLRHAGAASVKVSIEARHGHVAVSITDDGRGFDPETADRGNGLVNMQTRVEALGGQFAIASGATGTLVSCRFPGTAGGETQ
ncbi:sensor histidine kinase [Pelagibacterium montanilacus]|uniref:sensor histidine kinase n=1 Tax=Pelagibacterium montanilacus TaxID=2185280 RepID=UPI0013DFD96A|nr:ATP-binding protein [Pelagibacterium montanilacus]